MSIRRILVIALVACFALALQTYLVRGLSLGAVKG